MRNTPRVITKEDREACLRQLEEENPGYLEMEERLRMIVRILTGVRILYSIFYLAMSLLYEMPLINAVVNLISPFFFYVWYSYMLQSGRMIAVFMLLFRTGSIIYGGVSLLDMSFWLPYPLIFLLTLAILMEFTESVFCIYVLFHSDAAQAIRLNRELERRLQAGVVAPGKLEQMAAYRNACDGEEDTNREAPEEKETGKNSEEEQA